MTNSRCCVCCAYCTFALSTVRSYCSDTPSRDRTSAFLTRRNSGLFERNERLYLFDQRALQVCWAPVFVGVNHGCVCVSSPRQRCGMRMASGGGCGAMIVVACTPAAECCSRQRGRAGLWEVMGQVAGVTAREEASQDPCLRCDRGTAACGVVACALGAEVAGRTRRRVRTVPPWSEALYVPPAHPLEQVLRRKPSEDACAALAMHICAGSIIFVYSVPIVPPRPLTFYVGTCVDRN